MSLPQHRRKTKASGTIAEVAPPPILPENNSARNRPIIECEELWKVFGRLPDGVLQQLREHRISRAEAMRAHGCVVGLAGVSLKVERGDVCCVMGLSGSGKSTLVRHINGLIMPSAGRVRIDGVEITSMHHRQLRQIRAEKIGMVFQNFGLLPHRNVIENVAFGLELRRTPQAARENRAREMLLLVGLEGWERAFPHELSGGMQQRIGLARALASDPEILLLDEPFGALDPLIRRQLQDQFIQLSRTIGKTAVFITHDLEEALRIGTRIVIMKDGQVVQEGAPGDILLRPATDYVAQFVSGISKRHLLRASDLLSDRAPLAASLAACERIPAETTVAEAGRLAYGSTLPILVTKADGSPLGFLDRDRLLAAILDDPHDH